MMTTPVRLPGARRLGIGLVILATLFAACSPAPPPTPPLNPLTAADIANNNRGVALMGYFDYAGAREQFAAAVQQRPDWHDARINLAIATLNRQQEGDESTALTLVDDVLKENPGNLRAHYVAGLLRLYLSESDAALSHFETVVEGDPTDAYAVYYTAQVMAQTKSPGAALERYRRAIELDPYLRSAYYGAALSMRQLGDSDGAKKMLQDYQRFADNPRARLAEFKYTRMGPRAEALAAGAVAVTSPAPAGPVLLAGESVSPTNFGGLQQSLTVTDVQRDGLPDVFITGALKPLGLSNALIYARDDGELVLQSKNPLSRVDQVTAVAWGDYDNDGLIDAYLCRRGANQLWRQSDDDLWEDVTASTGTANGDHTCADTALFDADHDGDLDIFVVNADGPNELLSNNLDGTFRPLAQSQGLAGTGNGRQLLTTDLDGDRDVDILVINATAPHDVWLNDRLWQYRSATGFDALRQADIRAAVAGDLDTDGHVEIYTLDADGNISRWQRGDEWRGKVVIPKVSVATDDGLVGTPQLALLDINGDGRLDILAVSESELVLYALDHNDVATALYREAGAFTSVVPWLGKVEEGPGLLGLKAAAMPTNPGANRARLPAASAQLIKWLPGPGRHRFAALEFSGKEDTADSMRSNRSGIGTQAALRVGQRWTLADTFDHHSGPGQSFMPLVFGLGGASVADYVAITWSDGVFQTELDLAPGRHVITETQRQLSSCPVLFAWDGQGFAFLSDVLGVGGLGFFAAPGEVTVPRPWEYFRLPANQLQPVDGQWVFKLTEPMEEIAYLDSAFLHVIDVPEGWHQVLDERMAIAGAPATGELLFYRDALLPVHAINDRDEDVTQVVSIADNTAAPTGSLDPRFVGRLQNPHVLTLEFAQSLTAGPGQPVLVADGWVEYPYSQTLFAAWQASAAYDAPTLEARGEDGQWRVVAANFGYPAGMPREMALPLTGLPAGTTALRLTTTLEVYWDRLRVAFVQAPPAAVSRQVVQPASARLARTGFPLRTDGPQRRPYYDYSRRADFWDTRYPPGYYTAIGDVTPLVAATDDALAIFGPGEEVELRFPVLPGRATGQRVFVLELRGWAKDMDMYTRDGESVGPLPVHGGDSTRATREALHERFNTRFEAGH